MYKVNIKSKDDYYTIINYLFKICDRFKVVNMYEEVKNIGKVKFTDELRAFCIGEEKVKKWPGMVKAPKSIIRTYLCNKKTLKLFKEYKNFFEYRVEDNTGYYDTFGCDGQIDISFYNNDVCVLYTVGHEGLCISGDIELEIILNKNNIDFENSFKQTIKK